MEEKERIQNVPYIVYESTATRLDRTNKRLLIALIISLVLFFVSNTLWLHAWMQYDYEDVQTIEAEQDGDGQNFISGGDFTYGTES